MRVEEGQLAGGLPCVAVGSGPPLVVLGGLSAEHGPPGMMERWPPVRTFGRPFQRVFRVFLVSRRIGLPAGTTMADRGRTAQRLLAERTLAGQHRAALAAHAKGSTHRRCSRPRPAGSRWSCKLAAPTSACSASTV